MTYNRTTGEMLQGTVKIAQCYSGNGKWENRPENSDVAQHGPLPAGEYKIGTPEDTKSHGPYVMVLTPSQTNQMFGRSGFLIHGDSKEHPGDASKGCIVTSRAERERIWCEAQQNGCMLTVT